MKLELNDNNEQYKLVKISDNEFIIVDLKAKVKENTNTFKDGINGDWYWNSKHNQIANIGDITEFDFKILFATETLNLGGVAILKADSKIVQLGEKQYVMVDLDIEEIDYEDEPWLYIVELNKDGYGYIHKHKGDNVPNIEHYRIMFATSNLKLKDVETMDYDKLEPLVILEMNGENPISARLEFNHITDNKVDIDIKEGVMFKGMVSQLSANPKASNLVKKVASGEMKERINYIIDENGWFIGKPVNISGVIIQAKSLDELKIKGKALCSIWLKTMNKILESDEPFEFHEETDKMVAIYGEEIVKLRRELRWYKETYGEIKIESKKTPNPKYGNCQQEICTCTSDETWSCITSQMNNLKIEPYLD